MTNDVIQKSWICMNHAGIAEIKWSSLKNEKDEYFCTNVSCWSDFGELIIQTSLNRLLQLLCVLHFVPHAQTISNPKKIFPNFGDELCSFRLCIMLILTRPVLNTHTQEAIGERTESLTDWITTNWLDNVRVIRLVLGLWVRVKVMVRCRVRVSVRDFVRHSS